MSVPCLRCTDRSKKSSSRWIDEFCALCDGTGRVSEELDAAYRFLKIHSPKYLQTSDVIALRESLNEASPSYREIWMGGVR